MKRQGFCVLAAMFTAALAHATILPPTGSSPVPPTALPTAVTGPFLANTGLQPFSAMNSLGQTTITGEYDAMVYSDPGNEFCAGCLDFFVMVESSTASTDDIERITLASFGTYQTDVGYSIGPGSAPGGVPPATVDRSTNGSVIGFNFSTLPGVAPGDSTQVLEIETNATAFMQGTLQMIDSSVASVPAFEPCPTPEPGSISLTLLGAALLGIGFIGRRRRGRG